MIERSKYAEILKLMPIPCVDLAIISKGKCLLIKRTEEPLRGMWYFPGGRILKGQTIKEAALAIAYRECGLKCDFIGKIDIYDYSSDTSQFDTDIQNIVVICLLSCENSDNVVLDNTSSEYLWVTNLRDYLKNRALEKAIASIMRIINND